MKRILLFVLAAVTNICLAVPLSGNYTIGGTGSDYASITSAVQSLTTNGVSGAVVFNIKPGEYMGEYTLPMITGSTAANTITFQSETGNPNDVILLKTGARVFLVSGKNLRFKNLHFAVYTGLTTVKNAIDLNNSACEDILISGCAFSGSTLTTTSSYDQNETSKIQYAYLILRGSNITIDGNVFSTSNTAIYRTNSLNLPISENISITNNTFEGTFINLVELNRIRNLVFSGNQNSGNVKYLTLKALSICGNSFISGNSLTSQNTDVTQNSFSIYLAGSSAETSNITIQNNFLSTGSYLHTNSFTNVNIYNNSFKTGKSYCIALINSPATVKYNIYNNIFSSIDEFANIRYIQGLPFSKVNMNNNAYGKEHNAVQYFAQGSDENHYYDLTAWKSFASKDQNSPVVDNVYASVTDLHTPNAMMLSGAGSAIPAVATDIDGQTRNAIPDIGADEFDMDLTIYRDLELVNIVSPLNMGCENAPFILSVKNNSSFPVSSFSIECSLNNFRGNVSNYIQTIDPGQTVNITLNGCEITKNTFFEKFDFYALQPNNMLDNNYANNKLSIANVFQLGSFRILSEGNECNSEHKLYVPKIGNATVLWSTGATTNTITVSQPGSYSATITGTNGCTQTQTINID